MTRKGFTLLEVLITVIIIGILATLGLANYQLVVENTHDKKAQSNLKLIRNAERIYRMEQTVYVSGPNTGTINNLLKLAIPNPPTNAPWLYTVTVTSPTSAFTAKAVRNVSDSRRRAWCISQNPDIEPYTCSP